MNDISEQRTGGRNDFIDVLKALAIVLVVIAHCIQCGSGQDVLSEDMYYDDPVFKFITSFHIPFLCL